MIGSTLGQYRIDAEISRGGMGTIYRATHVETGRVAAVKVLQPVLAADRVFLQRFRREVRALQQVEHPNVIEIVDVGQEGDIHYFAMEHLEQSLADLLRGGPLAPAKALQIARQVADGLEAAHAAAIFHRDIKPGNILFTPDGCAKISDFGIAHVHEATRMTQTGAIVGTPTYMSPEQAEGPNVDARADIYSLGVVLYEMTTGKAPFEGRTALDTLRQHRFSLPESPKTLHPHLPAALASLILQMLEKSPARRPPSMAWLAIAFERLERNLAAGEEPDLPLRTRQPSAAELTDHYERTVRRLVAWARRVALLAAFALVAYAVYRLGAYLRRSPDDYLREAQAIEADDADEALATYQALAKRFPDSTEAEEARERIRAIEERQRAARKPELSLHPPDTSARTRAEVAWKHFQRAKQEAEKGRIEHAKSIYRMVCEHFADTPWGPRADARLQELEARTPAKPEGAPPAPPSPSESPDGPTKARDGAAAP